MYNIGIRGTLHSSERENQYSPLAERNGGGVPRAAALLQAFLTYDFHRDALYIDLRLFTFIQTERCSEMIKIDSRQTYAIF